MNSGRYYKEILLVISVFSFIVLLNNGNYFEKDDDDNNNIYTKQSIFPFNFLQTSYAVEDYDDDADNVEYQGDVVLPVDWTGLLSGGLTGDLHVPDIVSLIK